MVSPRIPGYALLGVLLIATPALARVVISEVMWMGSDRSTADEWVELTCTEECPQALSGWTLASLGSDGAEKTLVRFGEVAIGAGQYAVVSNYPAADSRLATDPILTTTAMMLPNTKLLLRLRDGSGNIVDEVDDGIGVPFAGANPSGTGAKAGMERMSLLGAGNVKENWQTAFRTIGFDPGVPIFGTPGFAPVAASSSSMSSASADSSLFSSSSESFLSSVASASSSSVTSVASVSSVPSCISDVSNIHIAIQSGEPRGEEKVTINLQFLWEGKGTLRCAWEYGDGFTSASCNPPSHTFTVPGTYDVRADAEDACGGKTLHVLPVEVLAGGETKGGGGGAAWWTGSSVSSGSCVPRTLAGVEITRFLPNPEGEDGRGEWVELRNVSDRVAVLCGWLLDDTEGGSAPFPLDTITLAPKEIRRLSASLTGIGLNNDQDHIRLFAPAHGGNPVLVQEIAYANAREGIVMNALLPTQETQGRVVRVIDGDTVTLAIADREVTVRLLGIDAPELSDKKGSQWGTEAAEFLRGLLEGATVGLDFDEERQDVYGRILAYLSIGGHDVQAELLKLGLAAVYERCTCTRKEEYFRLEEEARERGVGMWGRGAGSGSTVSKVGTVGTVGETGEKKWEKTGMVISEVYPAPLPAEGEWAELWNGGEEPLDLSRWKLDDAEGVGSRAWEFPEGFIIQPGAFIVLRSDQTHLAFNNEGDSVVLLAPEQEVVDRVAYGKFRRGRAFARVIQRIGSTGEFRATDRFCVTDHPTPFERNICRVMVSVGDTHTVTTSPNVRRVVRAARRVRYRNVLPAASGSVGASDPLFAALLERMDRSVQSGQIVWREEDSASERENTVEWEAVLLPLLLVVGAHSLLIGVRRGL